MSGPQPENRLLRHVVLFAFSPGSSPDEIQGVVDAFRSLPGKIEEIQDFEWGTDVSVEQIARGYTHCFFLTFRSAEDRDAYLVHPEHQAFGTLVRPHLAQVLVLDYWANREE